MLPISSLSSLDASVIGHCRLAQVSCNKRGELVAESAGRGVDDRWPLGFIEHGAERFPSIRRRFGERTTWAMVVVIDGSHGEVEFISHKRRVDVYAESHESALMMSSRTAGEAVPVRARTDIRSPGGGRSRSMPMPSIRRIATGNVR